MNQKVSNKLMVNFDGRTFYNTALKYNIDKHRGR
jgi:hypothetical protein